MKTLLAILALAIILSSSVDNDAAAQTTIKRTPYEAGLRVGRKKGLEGADLECYAKIFVHYARVNPNGYYFAPGSASMNLDLLNECGIHRSRFHPPISQ